LKHTHTLKDDIRYVNILLAKWCNLCCNQRQIY